MPIKEFNREIEIRDLATGIYFSSISAQFSLNIKSYGSGPHNATKIEISTDNVVNYTSRVMCYKPLI